MRRFTRLYGGGPLHAAVMLASFTVAGYVVAKVLKVSHAGWIGVWLAGAIVAHDLVLFPLYTGADRLLSRRRRRGSQPAVPWKNHVRAPVVVSGILLLITFPLVLGLSEPGYLQATGLDTSVYLGRWSLVTGCLFAASGIVYTARWAYAVHWIARRAARQGTGAPMDAESG